MANALYRLRGTNSVGPSVSIDFVTDDGSSDDNADDVGQSFSTLMGCKVQVLKADGTVLGTYTPGTQGTTVDCPSGVVVSSAI
jgi:hypothetical protein